MNLLARPRASIVLGAGLLLVALSPAFLFDFGVHNDWRIGAHALLSDGALAHVESYHLVRVGRALNAVLYNLQWKQIDSHTDLRQWRFASALLVVACFVVVALHLRRSALPSGGRAAFFTLALFLAPPITIDVYYASLFVPGTLGIVLASGTFVAQRRFLDGLPRAAATRRRLVLWSIVTVSGLTVGHFVYTPSVAFFLVLAALHALYGPASSQSRRRALLELGAYIASCVLYFVLQRALVLPWAAEAFAYSSLWTDSRYSFRISLWPGREGLSFLRDSVRMSLGAWNAFASIDAGWIVTPVIGLALARAAFARVERERRRHGLFLVGFLVACFGAAVAPAVLTNFPWADYRVLVCPILLACIAFLWALSRLAAGSFFAVSPQREPWVLGLGSIVLAAAAFATLATGVREARAEVECLQRFALGASRTASIRMVIDESGPRRSRLRKEFGYRVDEVGPLDEFAFEVTRDLIERGRLAPTRAAQWADVPVLDLEAAERLRGAPGIAVLDVGSCACVAGSVCEGLR